PHPDDAALGHDWSVAVVGSPACRAAMRVRRSSCHERASTFADAALPEPIGLLACSPKSRPADEAAAITHDAAALATRGRRTWHPRPRGTRANRPVGN